MRVRDRMTANPITVQPQTSVNEALRIMQGRKIRRLPVVQDGRLVGIVTLLDLMRVSASPATTLSVYELRYLLDRLSVQEAMTRQVITIHPDEPIEQAALLMREHKIGGLPVVENGRLVGIITETDIFDALVDLLGVRQAGARLEVDCPQRPDLLAKVATVLGEHGVQAVSLVSTPAGAGRTRLVARVQPPPGPGLYAALAELGCQVRDSAGGQAA
ncbi:MAG TPA: CBS and ACT domain-containing protein [Limnochordales bacterium]